MNFDKDDLFRNLLPGFVFIVVVFSYYSLVSQELLGDDFFKGVDFTMLIIASFVFGFFITVFYKTFFHVASSPGDCGLASEQTRIEVRDAELMPYVLRLLIWDGLKARISPEFVLKDERIHEAKIISQFLSVSLNSEKHEAFSKRLNFIMSYVHALGSAACAIWWAFAFVIFIEFRLFDTKELKTIFSETAMMPFAVCWFLIWIFIFIFLCKARENTLESQHLAMASFVNSSEFYNYVHNWRGW